MAVRTTPRGGGTPATTLTERKTPTPHGLARTPGSDAERSGRATKEIAALIGEVHRETQAAVEATQAGAGEVASGATLAQDSATALDEIAGAAEARNEVSTIRVVTAVDSISEIAAATNAGAARMGDNAEAVTGAVSSIASVSEENSAAAAEVSPATEELSAQVEEFVASARYLSEIVRTVQWTRQQPTGPPRRDVDCDRPGRQPTKLCMFAVDSLVAEGLSVSGETIYAPIKGDKQLDDIGVFDEDDNGEFTYDRRLIVREDDGRPFINPDQDQTWGYPGQGPHMLAASILCDVMRPRESEYTFSLGRMFQIDVTGALSGQDWQMRASDVATWLGAHLSRRSLKNVAPRDNPCPGCGRARSGSTSFETTALATLRR